MKTIETEDSKQSVIPEFLAGGGEMGARMREFDWETTGLGAPINWPQSLKTCVRIMLTSRQPIWIGWGPDLIKMYNDPYIQIVGGKHPSALGSPASIVWKDIWDDIAHMLRTVMEEDKGTYVESQLLIMERNGYPEETYYTFSYTPIPGDDGRTAGMFCANTDDTKRIIHERQLKTLSGLAKRLIDCKSETDIYNRTIETLGQNPFDFPFVLIRTIEGDKAVLAAHTSLGDSVKLAEPVIDLKEPGLIAETVNAAFHAKKPQVFNELIKRIGIMPRGEWKTAPDRAIVMPIMLTGNTQPVAVIIFGLNPYRPLDEEYWSFFSLIADQITTSVVELRAFDEERKRMQALAELDRAKSTFFSNISHEFRTPLTLLLGPIEEVISRDKLSEDDKSALNLALRNGHRMQKLVNNLLDFSRAEAGRLEGRFQKVDVISFTRELVSLFQPVLEGAGLSFSFHTKAMDDEVFVDPEMWEKIVVNLLSNAYKYTEKGSIDVRLEPVNFSMRLTVCDTGVGIPGNQQEKIFDRFHRVDNSGGRSQEGTGIGLAMVKELVKVHKGTINVESEEGKGSCFIVEFPLGRRHLVTERLAENLRGSGPTSNVIPVIEEARMWQRGVEASHHTLIEDGPNAKPKVLLADDNADMREYVSKILSGKFDLVTAVDGEEAFNKAISVKPDLILSDIMMPRMDGYQVLSALRDHPETRTIPVIFLSAKAGEEAKLEGIVAGADDYLIKPFSARELLVRVEANIKISKTRAAAEKNLRTILLQAPAAMTLLMGKSHRIELANDMALELWGRTHEQVINRPILEALPEIAEQGFDAILEKVFLSGEPFYGNEVPLTLERFGVRQDIYLNYVYEPMHDEAGEVTGIFALGVDVTPQVEARKVIERSEQELKVLANAMPQLVWVANALGEVLYYNNRIDEFYGVKRHANGLWKWDGMVNPQDLEETVKKWNKSVSNGEVFELQHRLRLQNGEYRWYLSRAIPQKNETGEVIRWFGTATDIHDSREQAETLEMEVKRRTKELHTVNVALTQSNEDLLQFAHVASHDLKEPVRKIMTFTGRVLSSPSVVSEKERTYLEKVVHAAERMTAMIEGVLNYSTLNATKQPIEKVNLVNVFRDVESDLEVLIVQKGAVIKHVGDFPEVEGASVLMHQLFYNLINNSLKFSDGQRKPEITVSSKIVEGPGEEQVHIEVADNGIGFEEKYATKIFNTFTRLNSKDQFEGTGIGLALCKKIVERHHGNISASSSVGEGAVFTINLPVTQKNQNI